MRFVVFIAIAFGVVGAYFLMLSRGEADPSTAVSRPDDSGQKGSAEQPEDRAERSFLRGDYRQAAAEYRLVVEREPDNSLAWARLAYASHELGEFEIALARHQRASEFPENRLSSLYKLGCALARLGREEEAIAALERAVEAGYRDRGRAEQDSDLDSLRDLGRFKRVLNRMAPPPRGRGPMDFWTGHWVVRDSETGRVTGSSTIQRVDESHLYLEQWDAYGGASVRGMAFLDPSDGNWQMVRVLDSGEVHRLKGVFRDGALHLDGERVHHAGQVFPMRMVIGRGKDGRIRQSMDYSEDSGKTWTVLVDGLLSPEEPVWTGRGRR